MRINPESLAKASSRTRGDGRGIWLVVLAAAIAPRRERLFGGALTNEIDFTNEPEAKAGRRP